MSTDLVSAAPADSSLPLPPPAPDASPEHPVAPAASTAATTKKLDDLPAVIEDQHAAAGRAPTGVTYANHVRRFLRWLKDRAIDPATMAATTADEFLSGEYTNLITRNVAASSIGLLNEAAIQHGVPFAVQTPTRAKTPRTRQAVPPPAAPQPALAPNTAPAPGPGMASPGASEPQGVVAVPVAQIGAAKAGPKKATSVLPSLGGRIRVSKRITGTEGTGAPIGSLALVGTYSLDDIDGEGSIANFIANYIRPHYGPRPGENAATYYVDRLDNLGNPIPNATVLIPVFPELGTPAGVAPAQPVVPQTLGSTGDRFLDFSLRRLEDMEQRYEELRGKYEEQVQTGKMDAGMMALLLERERPKPVDAKALREEFMAMERQGSPVSGPTASSIEAALGGLSPAPKNDATIDALTGMVRDLTTKVTDLASRPAQQAPVGRDPVELFSGMLTAFSKMAELSRPAPVPEDPIRAKLIEAALTKVINPEKPKTLPEVISEMKALRDAQEFLGGGPQEKPGFGDILLGLIENSDKVGAAIGDIVAKIPKLPIPPRAEQKALQPPAQAGRSTTPPLPDAAKHAFVQLRDLPADQEQEIVSALYTILQEVGAAPSPWPRVAQYTLRNFGQADSRPEIRSVVTQLFTWCGAKSIASEEVIEKLTNVLHRNYTFIFATMFNGQEKHLADQALTARVEPRMEPSEEQLVELAQEEGQPHDEDDDQESDDVDDEPGDESQQEEGETEEDEPLAADAQPETPADHVSSGVVGG